MSNGATAALSMLLAAALWTQPVVVVAQSPDLDRVEALMSEGRFTSSRELLQEWMDGGRDSASREDVQRGLWLKALLTVDAQMAEIDLQRLIVEYRGGPYSDAALLRLAQVESARSDPDRAERRLESLLQDYPGSSHAAEARVMLAELREAPRPDEAAVAPAVAPSAPPSAEPPIAVAAVDSSDVPAPSPAAPDSEPATPRPAEPEPAVLEPGLRPPRLEPTVQTAPVEPLPFTVQLGAFSTESRAQTMAASADASGFDVRVVHVEGSDLIHVRSGAFASREEADARAAELRGRGLPALVATDRAAETPVP